VELLDPQPGDGPGDHELLDLLGALENVEGLPDVFGVCQIVALTCCFSNPS